MDLIIGAGVSGISYAGFTKSDYLIIEKNSEIGGYCRTIKRNNFVWDYSGHFFHFRDMSIQEHVCRHLLQKELPDIKKCTQILYGGKYIDFPFQKNIHQLEKEEFIDCLYDLFIEKGEGVYKSFKEMVYGNYGKSIAEKFLIPYNEKLYACDLNNLDMNAMGRFFPKASKEDIIRNFRNQDNMSYNSTFKYPSGGAIEYVNSLMNYADLEKICINEELLHIDIKKKVAVTSKRELSYDKLISTIPFPALLKACGIQYNHEDFTCNKVLVLNLGFSAKGTDTTNNWIYVPSPDIIFYRFGYYDNILNSNQMSLYVEIGFPEDQQLESNSFYLDRVLSDLKKIGVITNQELVDFEILLMNPAYVHITERSNELMKFYKKELSKEDIFSIGRYGSWTYCSIEDNVIEARDLSNRIL